MAVVIWSCISLWWGLGQMTEAPLLKLEEICRQQKVMLVIARSYGLAGLVRLSVMVWQYVLWLTCMCHVYRSAWAQSCLKCKRYYNSGQSEHALRVFICLCEREQSSWLSSLCICILCVDLGIVVCRSWNRSMLLLSQNQITKWRISDFINLGLNFKGLFWTRFIHFADRMEQPCLLTVKELGCRTFLLPFLVVCTSYLHMCEEWLSMKSQIFLWLYQYYLWFWIYIALCRFVDEFDIDTPDNNIHKHIPFAILLIKIADDWRKAHDGKLPANVREFKVRFRLPQCSYFLDIWQQQTG